MNKAVLLVVMGVCLYACAPSTEITGSWKNPQSRVMPVRSVLVTALTNKTLVRQSIENDLVAALERRGVRAVKSLDILPPSFTDGNEPDKKELLDKVNGTDVDAILTIAIINKETESRYVPGNYRYEPVTRYRYYGRFWGYYTTWYPTLYSPGYYTEDKTYFIETNLYDADSEMLLWSAQSETYNPVSLPDFSMEFATVVLDKMEREGVLRTNGVSTLY